jgi:dihydrolipoamide dehydrogenase
VYDLVIIGGGPAGYVAAIRAVGRGLKVALVERRFLGGECANWGCIPTKTFLEVAEAFYKAKSLRLAGIELSVSSLSEETLLDYVRRAALRTREGIKSLLSEVDLVEGFGRISGPHEVEIVSSSSRRFLKFRYALIATGSEPKGIPGVEFDGEYVISNREFFELRRPPESMVIVGAGAVGVEVSTALAMLNKEIYLVELLDRVLYFTDPDVSAVVERSLRRFGIRLYLRSTVKRVEKVPGGVRVFVSRGTGSEEVVEVEKVLVAVGRRPNVEGIGLEVVGVRYDPRVGIHVDESLRTSIPNILAAGDVVGPPQLAHKAFREGMIAADTAAGVRSSLPRFPVPQVVFSHPQVAIVGKTEEEVRASGLECEVYRFPYVALGRNTTALLKSSEGFAKLIVEKGSGRILGAEVVGNEASEIIHIFALAIAYSMRVPELANVIYTHPTYSEVIGELAHLALGEPLHMPKVS